MKIKRYISDEPLRVTPASPGVSSLVARTGVGMGEAVRGLGADLAKIHEGRLKVESALAAQGGLDEYRTAMEGFFNKLDEDPDKTNYVGKVKHFSQKKIAEIFGKIKSPAAQEWLKLKFSDADADYEIQARQFENRYFVSTKKGEYREKFYNGVKYAANAPDEKEMVRRGSEIIQLIDSLTGTILSPEEASAEKIKLDRAIEIERKRINYNRAADATYQNPVDVEAIIDEYNIESDEAMRLRNLAVTTMDRREREETKEAKKLSDNKVAWYWTNPDKWTMEDLNRDYGRLRIIRDDADYRVLKAFKEKGGGIDDSETEFWLNERMARNIDVHKDIVNAVIGKRLSFGTASESILRNRNIQNREGIFASDDYKQAHKWLLNPMRISGPGAMFYKTGELEYRNDAERYFNNLVREKKNPWEAAEETRKRYPIPKMFEAGGAQSPLFMKKPILGPERITTMEDIEEAEKRIVDAMTTKKLTTDQVREELNILKDLKEAVQYQEELRRKAEEAESKRPKR